MIVQQHAKETRKNAPKREARREKMCELKSTNTKSSMQVATQPVFHGFRKTSLKCAAIAIAAITIAIAGCGGKDTSQASASPAASSSTPNLFSIPQNQMAHIQVLTAEPTTLTRVLSLPGTVDYDSFLTTPVITPIGGPITRIVAVPGQSVRRGQPLLYVASPDYSQLLATYLKAKQASDLAQKSYARAQALFQHHAIAEQDLQQQAAANAEAQSDVNASEAALKALGIQDPEALLKAPPSLDAALRAPISGEIVEKNVSVGQLVQAGTTQCFLVSNTGTVWVLVNIYQKDLPYVHVGDPVTIETDTYPEPFHGRISYLAAALDPTTRTLQARIETRNPDDELKKGMYVTALVDSGVAQNIIAVPDSAVLRDSNNEPFVYIERPDGKFARHSVTVGESQQGKTQVTSGLEAGQRYIANGSLFVQFGISLQ